MKKLNKVSLNNVSKLEGMVFNQNKKVAVHIEKYKSLPRSVKKELQKRGNSYIEVSTENLLFDIEIIIELQNFIEHLLSIVFNNPLFKVSFKVSPTNIKDFIHYILKDRNFKNYIIYSLMDEKPKNIIGSNIISLLFFYIFKDKKITVSRIKHFLSMFIVKSGVEFEVKSKLKTNHKILLNQIKTGIRDEREKNLNPANNTEYKRKNKKFSISNIAENFIKIKYTSNLNGSHRFHKSPIEHIRNGHYRHYENGKVVWISSCVINKRCA